MKALLPFSWLYALVMFLRNMLFDLGILKSESAGVPVISVGNLTVGGTGKTPLVEYIVDMLLRKGMKVAVVSRGYKRKSSGVVVVSDAKHVRVDALDGGDEPVQIAMKFPEAIVVVGEKRVDAAKQAVQLGAEVIVLDDGFQHRFLRRDLDVVVVDASTDFTKDAVLPAGRLREPLAGLRRASIVALSKYEDSVASTLRLDEKVASRVSAPVVTFRYRVKEVRRAADDVSASIDVVRTMRLLAFSGIGKHETFIDNLLKNRFTLVSDMRFSDHHPFSEGDVETLVSFAKALRVDACITTEKDVVRLRSANETVRRLFAEIAVFYLVIEVEMLQGGDRLDSLINNCLSKGQLHDNWGNRHSQQEG